MSLGQCCIQKSRCYLPSTHGLLPSKVQENPEERVTPVAMYTGPEPASSSSAAADTEMQLPAPDKRAVGTVDEREMEEVHNESKRAKTIGELRAR